MTYLICIFIYSAWKSYFLNYRSQHSHAGCGFLEAIVQKITSVNSDYMYSKYFESVELLPPSVWTYLSDNLSWTSSLAKLQVYLLQVPLLPFLNIEVHYDQCCYSIYWGCGTCVPHKERASWLSSLNRCQTVLTTQGSDPGNWFRFDSAFHPFEVGKMSTQLVGGAMYNLHN